MNDYSPQSRRGRRAQQQWSLFLCVLFASAVILDPATGTAKVDDKPAGESNASFWQEIPSAAFKFEMVLIPGDPERNIPDFWIGKTEMTWEAFDVFVYRLDENEESSAEVDAVTRPTKPYLPPDRGFGHEGYAVISVSHHMATEFCKWLSAKSGKHYRLPTEAEWEHACRAESNGAFCFGDDAQQLGEFAWFAANANGMPRPVALKKANAWGLHDMHGNVTEWCNGNDGEPITCGGSYRDAAEKVMATSRAPFDPAWNASDPQIPKSEWWLADGPFVGFRVVCEIDAPALAEQVSETQPVVEKAESHVIPVEKK